MLAASYWSLLNPAIEMAEKSESWGPQGRLAFIPVSIGFAFGAAFVFAADKLLPYLVSNSFFGPFILLKVGGRFTIYLF